MDLSQQSIKPTPGQRQQSSIDNLSISVVTCFRLVDIRTLCLFLLLVLFVCDIDYTKIILRTDFIEERKSKNSL